MDGSVIAAIIFIIFLWGFIILMCLTYTGGPSKDKSTSTSTPTSTTSINYDSTLDPEAFMNQQANQLWANGRDILEFPSYLWETDAAKAAARGEKYVYERDDTERWGMSDFQ